MVIVSIKAIEKLSIEWIVKARIVFRGDAVRDEENQAALSNARGAWSSQTRLQLLTHFP